MIEQRARVRIDSSVSWLSCFLSSQCPLESGASPILFLSAFTWLTIEICIWNKVNHYHNIIRFNGRIWRINQHRGRVFQGKWIPFWYPLTWMSNRYSWWFAQPEKFWSKFNLFNIHLEFHCESYLSSCSQGNCGVSRGETKGVGWYWGVLCLDKIDTL